MSFKFVDRYAKLVYLALNGNYRKFVDSCRLRVVVAGHDLKFAEELIRELGRNANVQIDKWKGHRLHDEPRSRELLAWGDLVWVEWLLGASVWYSKRIRGDQRLIVRAHRSEMTIDYGVDVDYSRVSAIVCIAPDILSDFVDRFDIPRDKVWLIPNILDVDAYETGTYSEDRMNRIAMVGVLPRLKGLKRAICLLGRLHDHFPELELHLYGKAPDELDWVRNDPLESAYYKECNELISRLGLESFVHWRGWVDTTTALSEVALVISMSDYEGMQVSVAEGFCSGGLGLTLDWRGAYEGYPKKWVFTDVESMAGSIVQLLRDPAFLKAESVAARPLIRYIYGIEENAVRIEKLVKSVRA